MIPKTHPFFFTPGGCSGTHGPTDPDLGETVGPPKAPGVFGSAPLPRPLRASGARVRKAARSGEGEGSASGVAKSAFHPEGLTHAAASAGSDQRPTRRGRHGGDEEDGPLGTCSVEHAWLCCGETHSDIHSHCHVPQRNGWPKLNSDVHSALRQKFLEFGGHGLRWQVWFKVLASDAYDFDGRSVMRRVALLHDSIVTSKDHTKSSKVRTS